MVQCLAQGHFELWTARAGDRAANPVISRRSHTPWGHEMIIGKRKSVPCERFRGEMFLS